MSRFAPKPKPNSSNLFKLLITWAKLPPMEFYENVAALNQLLKAVGFQYPAPKVEDLARGSSYMLCLNCGAVESVDMFLCAYSTNYCEACIVCPPNPHMAQPHSHNTALNQVAYLGRLFTKDYEPAIVSTMLVYYLALDTTI